jgi:large subunit ribosomal protein L15
MELNELPKTGGMKKKRKRVGRGIGSGSGKRCGRGQKGQSSRSGGTKGPQFEGGQMPIFRRLPALRGFKHQPRFVYAIVNLNQLEELPAGLEEIDNEVLFEHNLIRKPTMKVKLLARGEVKRKFNLRVHAASAKAIEMVTAAGGNVEVLG